MSENEKRVMAIYLVSFLTDEPNEARDRYRNIEHFKDKIEIKENVWLIPAYKDEIADLFLARTQMGDGMIAAAITPGTLIANGFSQDIIDWCNYHHHEFSQK